MSALRGEKVDNAKSFGSGAAGMSVIGAPIASSAVTGLRDMKTFQLHPNEFDSQSATGRT
jgi:hypothetical protein